MYITKIFAVQRKTPKYVRSYKTLYNLAIASFLHSFIISSHKCLLSTHDMPTEWHYSGCWGYNSEQHRPKIPALMGFTLGRQRTANKQDK